MTTKLVKDLTTGDVLVSEDGEALRIASIGKGFMTYPSKLITYTNGLWSCLGNTVSVEVKA